MTKLPHCFRPLVVVMLAVGFAVLRFPDPPPPAVAALHGWLSTWTGIGAVAAGMARQGYDLSLTRYDGLGWRATFYATGIEHSATAATGSEFMLRSIPHQYMKASDSGCATIDGIITITAPSTER